MEKINLVITCCGGQTIPSIVANLRASEKFSYRIYGVDADISGVDQTPFDGVFQVPDASSLDFVDAMLSLCRSLNAKIVLPYSDEEVLSLSKCKDAFLLSGTKIISSEYEAIKLIENKFETYKKLEHSGIHTPECYYAENWQALLRGIDKLGFPLKSCIIKPVKGRGGRGVWILCGTNPPESWVGSGSREKVISQNEWFSFDLSDNITFPVMVMPCLSSPCYDVDVLKLTDSSFMTCIRRRLNPPGIPYLGSEIIIDQAIRSYCESIIDNLNLSGLHDIDLMTDECGRPVLLEVNPRPSGSLIAALDHGIRFIDCAIEKVLN